jgi:hypothetical protein
LLALVHSMLQEQADPAGATAPGAEIVLVSGLFAGALTFAFWWIFGHAVTLAHEGGHAVTAVLLGGSVKEIELNRDRTGATTYVLGSLRQPLVTLSGYIGPSVFGLLGAVVLSHGYAEVVLVGSIALLALALFVTPSWFGRLVIVVLGAVLFVFARNESQDMRLFVACAWIWLLLLGGLAHILEHGRHGADHATLRRRTHIPTLVWAVLFSVVAVVSLVASSLMLLGLMDPPG